MSRLAFFLVLLTAAALPARAQDSTGSAPAPTPTVEAPPEEAPAPEVAPPRSQSTPRATPPAQTPPARTTPAPTRPAPTRTPAQTPTRPPATTPARTPAQTRAPATTPARPGQTPTATTRPPAGQAPTATRPATPATPPAAGQTPTTRPPTTRPPTTTRPAQPAGPRRPTAAEVADRRAAAAAFGRVRVAAADTAALVPQGPYPRYPAALAGVVWAPPASTADALDEMVALRRAGVRSVRLPLVRDTLLLSAADLLGLALWQDLPVANLAAPFLLDTLASAQRELAAALVLAQRHPSARHFGLALYGDTSDPRARPYFERLTAQAHADGPEGTQTYFLTRFPGRERCDRMVDLVLLDARDRDPEAMLARWRAAYETPAGIGAFGAAVRPGEGGGWRTPGSAAAQARTLERALGAFLRADAAPPVLFIYRWRDAASTGPVPLMGADVSGVAYGLRDGEGAARPALEVVQGFFTGTRRVFAFNAGPAPSGQYATAPLVLVGWGLVLVLGLLFAGTSRFPTLAGRYFGRHDLYREAVQRGYDLETWVGVTLAGGLALAAGIVATATLRGMARTDALAAATAGWGPDAQGRLAGLLGQPVLLTLLLAVAYALWLLLHLVWLHAVAGRHRRLRPSQALTLVTWSRWGVLVLLAAAMLLAAGSAERAAAGAPVLLAVWALIELVALGRQAADAGAVARIPGGRAWSIGFGLPALLLLFGLFAATLAARAELVFLWHLATRG